MRPNVKLFVELLAKELALPSPVVDIGALRVPGQEDYADLRPYMGMAAYVGVDMRAGPGVDALGSIHELPLRPNGAGTIIALDTLEHVLDPIAAARELCAAVRPGGIVAITSHMNFPIHAHPSDYWRFTPMAFDYLLSPLATSYVFMQGNAENPHTVIAIGMKASGGTKREFTFRQAVEALSSGWPEEAFGGPLVLHEALEIDASQRGAEQDVAVLADGCLVEQTFPCVRNGLRRIDIKMSNKTSGTFRHLMFRVYEVGIAEPVASHRLLAWHVIDDGWLPVPVPLQAHSSGKRYRLTIESSGQGEPVAVQGSPAAMAEGFSLRIDAVDRQGCIAIQTYCSDRAAMMDAQASAPLPQGERPQFETAREDAANLHLGRLTEEHWQHLRHVTAELTAGLDAIRDQIRVDHAAQLDLQRQTLDASLSKTVARTVRRTPLSWLFRGRRARGDRR